MVVPGQDGPPEPPPRGRYATRAEILAQLAALTLREKDILRKYAKAIARKSEGRVHHGDADDLLNTVTVKLLLEPSERKWYPEESEFFSFVMGCIRSIGHSWAKSARSAELSHIEGPSENEEERREAALRVDEMRAYLAECSQEHPPAVGVFDLLGDYTGPEIQKRLGITRQAYEATVKWIRRTLRKREAVGHD